MTDLPRVIDILVRPGAPTEVRDRALERWPDRQPRGASDDRAVALRLADQYLASASVQRLRAFPRGFVNSVHRGAYEAARLHLERVKARLERTRDDAVGKVKRRAAHLRATPGSFQERAEGPNTSVALTDAADTEWQKFLQRIAVSGPDGSSLLQLAATIDRDVEDALMKTRLGAHGLLEARLGARERQLVPPMRLDNISLAVAGGVSEQKARPGYLSGFRSSVSLVVAPVSITVTLLFRLGLKPDAVVHAWPFWAAGAAVVLGGSALVARAALASQRHELGERLRDGLVARLRDDAVAELTRLGQRLEARRQELADEVLGRLNTWAEEDEQLWLDAEALAAWRRTA